jgi:hypothetical protein
MDAVVEPGGCVSGSTADVENYCTEILNSVEELLVVEDLVGCLQYVKFKDGKSEVSRK